MYVFLFCTMPWYFVRSRRCLTRFCKHAWFVLRSFQYHSSSSYRSKITRMGFYQSNRSLFKYAHLQRQSKWACGFTGVSSGEVAGLEMKLTADRAATAAVTPTVSTSDPSTPHPSAPSNTCRCLGATFHHR